MKNKYIGEIIITLVLIGILIVCLNPLNFLMPAPIVSMLIILLLIVFGIFTAVIWKEKSKDEREKLHKYFAGHFAFLTGSAFLVIAISIQEINHNLDPWLVYILIIMILAKIIARIYSDKRL